MTLGNKFSGREVIGVAVAGAAALGGLIVALGRSHSAPSTVDRIGAALSDARDSAVEQAELRSLSATAIVERLMTAYPEVRRWVIDAAGRATDGFSDERDRIADALSDRAQQLSLPDVSAVLEALVDRLPASAEDLPQSVMESDLIAAVADKQDNRMRATIETLGVLVATSALIYALMRSPRRLEPLKDAACRAINFAQLMIDDLRGRDDPFESTG